jgi:radical SAM-linked protein
MVQVNAEPVILRVKFFKKGALQYISHLDLVRTVMKIIVRADLPLWYSMGYNTKPKVVFAAPLSIGTESECEYMDVRLTERISADDAMRRLNANMAPEMQAIECYYPESKLPELKWFEYDISIDTRNSSEALAQKCRDILAGDTLEITKKGKSGEEKTVDIKPFVKSFDIVYDGSNINISCVLCADQSSFLNPEHIIKLLRKNVGILSSEDVASEGYSIKRIAAYFSDMTPFR